ncbi:OmpA family protein [Lishizhenia sp.]|uniref:OmpA family protein n=1 Tax=Lishizhenia sp. TaxID=2497594 RepID=UPI00299F2457|nr:OmpA family protein [Lishizhenia sp.]MDX1446929.1 OmpA family protein [Lishizhenia sp.]
MRRISITFAFVISFLNAFGQDAASDSLALVHYQDSVAQRQAYIDSLLAVKPLFALSPEYYKDRYNAGDLTYKITDNRGDGFDSLYGTRNLRPILYGVAYRGGANNYYHKENKRSNHNPLPDDGIRNLCVEGFSASIYLYQENFDTAPQVDSCACVHGGLNDMDYYQYDYFDNQHIYEMLKLVRNSAINDSVGPVYLHCWNGWHASGLLAALTLRQFCGMSKWEAINYWDINTDGANNSPRYQKIRNIIKDFEPYPDLVITDSLGNRICPPMPENIDSSEIHVEVEHLVYVPESIPVGFSIVLYNTSFGSGKTSFSNPSDNPDLQNLLTALKEQPELKVEIGGYTDNSGSYSKNVQISAQRAKFVYNWLLRQGIDQSRISYKGYGPKKPLYSNRYKSTRAGNRRIEVKVLEKKVDNMDVLVDQGDEEVVVRRRDSLESMKIGESMVLSGVNFEPNQVVLTDSSKMYLDSLIVKIKAMQGNGFKVEIGGHTDKSGLEELNILLSQQRAEAVYNYLIEQGVNAKYISWKGYGSENPIESNKYQWGRELNRRVEITLLSKANS